MHTIYIIKFINNLIEKYFFKKKLLVFVTKPKCPPKREPSNNKKEEKRGGGLIVWGHEPGTSLSTLNVEIPLSLAKVEKKEEGGEAWPRGHPNLQRYFVRLSVREKAMASSPCDCWPHSSSSSSSSIEHVWTDIKLASLSNSSVDLDLNNNNHSVSVSSFLNQPLSTFLTLTSTSSSSSVFHKHDHSLLSVSDPNTLQDQRHTRVIKNRESAVRSRARKQVT